MNSSSTKLVYVDAAGWIALVNKRDALHAQAVQIYKERLQEQYQFLTAVRVDVSAPLLRGIQSRTGWVRPHPDRPQPYAQPYSP